MPQQLRDCLSVHAAKKVVSVIIESWQLKPSFKRIRWTLPAQVYRGASCSARGSCRRGAMSRGTLLPVSCFTQRPQSSSETRKGPTKAACSPKDASKPGSGGASGRKIKKAKELESIRRIKDAPN